MERQRINLQNLKEEAKNLKAGDAVLLSGVLYTARDQAHKRLTALLDEQKELPFLLPGAVIYYAGPTEGRPGTVVGACGPTTSGRMDAFAPRLLDLGLSGMVGKGVRSKEVKEAIVRNGAVYFAATGGAGALLSERIKSLEVIAFPELGCESIKRFEVVDFPAIVAIDSKGNDVYEEGPKAYKALKK